MWTRLVGMVVTAAGAAMAFGCSPRLEVPAAVVEDKVFTVTPAVVQLKAGIVTGEVDKKVTERIEQGSGSVVSPPAKLSGKLKLRNSATDQTVRFIGGKIQFIDTQGQPIRSDEKQIKPTIKFMDGDFPAEALKARRS